MAPSAIPVSTAPTDHSILKAGANGHNGISNSTGDNDSLRALGTTTSGKKLKVRTYPKFNTLEEERLYRKQHLAAAFRVFADRGFDEGVAGHISVRDPILTDHFWLNA